MSIKAVLFDLDGTLLPMNQDNFIKKYFDEISAYLYDQGGYEPQEFLNSMWHGIKAMITNDGSQTNEAAFWHVFHQIYGKERVEKDMPIFDRFYCERFPRTKSECGYTEKSKQIVDFLRQNNIKTVLATNPVFPSIATETRMGWVGLKPSDFELVTTYENIGFCKPNPQYYTEIAKKIGAMPQECLMVGNDVSDDMSAAICGMDVFLLTDCLINSKNEDISKYSKGGFEELAEYIKKSQES